MGCELSVFITGEPLNKGEVGTLTDVHYSEVVLYWEVTVVNPQCACSVRVTVVGSVYECLSVCPLSHMKMLSHTQ